MGERFRLFDGNKEAGSPAVACEADVGGSLVDASSVREVDPVCCAPLGAVKGGGVAEVPRGVMRGVEGDFSGFPEGFDGYRKFFFRGCGERSALSVGDLQFSVVAAEFDQVSAADGDIPEFRLAGKFFGGDLSGFFSLFSGHLVEEGGFLIGRGEDEGRA